MEKFTLTSADVFDVNFGCGEKNEGDYNGVDGLLGLGPGEVSFPSQTAKTYNNTFSYCLPSSSSYTGGHLTFGSAGISESFNFTPISSSPSNSYNYGLDITGITVFDKQLEIPSTVFSTSGAIIDSGTVITRLPPEAYAALKSAFKEKMSNYTITSGDRFLDTCYDFSGLKTVTIPKISFSFRGGTVVELDPKGILYPLENRSKVCLAFTKASGTAIFGSFQQQTLQVVYDRNGGQVGFAPNGCR